MAASARSGDPGSRNRSRFALEMSPENDTFLVDPDRLGIPDGLLPPPHEAGEVVLLLADAESLADGWAARMAAEVARTWADAGLHVLLADADLEGATLHERCGLPNGEGVSDLILFGASPARVSLAVPDAAFRFVPAGTAAGSVARVYRNPRWASLLGAFRESGTVLLLFLPAGAEGVDALLPEGDRVLRLAGEGAAPDPEPGVLVLQARPRERPVGFEGADADRDAEPGEIARLPGAETRTPGGATPPLVPEIPRASAPGTARASEPGTPRASDPGAAPRASAPGPRLPAFALLVVVLLLFVLLLVGAYLGIIEIPGVPAGGGALGLLPARPYGAT